MYCKHKNKSNFLLIYMFLFIVYSDVKNVNNFCQILVQRYRVLIIGTAGCQKIVQINC